MSELNTISPIDSRYYENCTIREICSYKNQIISKMYSEFEWLVFLCKQNKIYIKISEYDEIRNSIVENFDKFYEIEKITKHDIKAVEYYVKSIIENSNFYVSKSKSEQSKILSFIHFGLTSQDIVSLSTNLLFSHISYKLIYDIKHSINLLFQVFSKNNELMIGFTHGQPAIPIHSKLIYDNYSDRLFILIDKLLRIQPKVKFGGAIGNNSTLKLLGFQNIEALMDEFVRDFKLTPQYCGVLKRSTNTTQVDNWSYLVDLMKEYLQISSIFVDLCRDLWYYCSIGYLCQSKDKGQIGSSTMVQKTNPINFENCEGIMEKIESDFSFYITKLSKSRLQRDLTDSVVIRMVFESFAMFDVAIGSLSKGLSKVSLNSEYIKSELDNHYEMSAEYLQLFLKSKGLPNSYEIVLDILKTYKLTDLDSYKILIHKLLKENIITEEMFCILINFNLYDYK